LSPRRLLAITAALGSLVTLACRGEQPPPNVVLVSIDTLRADALGAYGSPLATPTLDRLAAEGARFELAFAPTPSTAPSHATLFTGTDVLRHGLLRNGETLREDLPTLAESLRAGGWHTAAFVSSFVLDARFGWARGFDLYDDELPDSSATMGKDPYPGAFWAAHRFAGFDRRATSTTQAAIAWLADAPEPFFLFVHYFDPHAPYLPPDAYERRAAGLPVRLQDRAVPGVDGTRLTRLIRRYHGEVLYTDDSLGALLEAVAARSRDRSVLTVITADHGEGLGQHGWIEHALHLYDEQVRVPLLVHWPGRVPAGHRVATQVGLADVTPTIADLLGLTAPGDADGRSLATSVRGGPEPEPRPLFGDRHLVAENTGWDRGVKSSVRTARWKLVRAGDGREELFDLSADPGELRNVAGREAAAVAALRRLLDDRLSAAPPAHQPAALSEETQRALRALGYAE
jgi:arylsulfatase A-like enzyme